MHKIIAVGGTGQDVLQLYLLAYLCGAVEKPFEAVILDADNVRPGIDAISQFLAKSVIDGANHTAFGPVVPKIQYSRVRPSGTRVADVLLGYSPDPQLTVADAFFDRENLMQTVDKGLFARPALSSVLSAELLPSQLLVPDTEGRVFVVGSVLGGTGGGLFARVIDAVYSHARANGVDPKIRAVIFGEYFEPTIGLIERTRMRSNQYMVLRALGEGAARLHSYSIVDVAEGRRIQDRVAMNTVRIPLPDDEQNPLWRGVNALQWLRDDEVMAVEIARFARREKEETIHLRVDDVRERLQRATSACSAFVTHRVPELVASEPWAERLWGRGLLNFTRNALTIVRRSDTTNDAVSPRYLSKRTFDLWEGAPGTTALAAVMPPVSMSTKPRYFRQLRWPDLSRRPPAIDDAINRLAANYLFHCMRETIV